MRRWFGVVLLTASLAQAAPVKDAQMTDEQAWKDGEAAIRKSLEQAKVTIKELRHTSAARVHVFSVVNGDNKAFHAIAAAGKVYLSSEPHSDDRVQTLLQAEKVLDWPDLAPGDILLIVHAFGLAPAEVQDGVDNGSLNMGAMDNHPPKLTKTGDGVAVEVFTARPGRWGAEAVPKDHLYKGTFTVSKTYKVKWKVESVDLER